MADPRKQELYVSIDVETDGPNPMENSLRSIGAAIFNADGKRLGTFYRNVKPLPGHAPHPQTLKWFLEPEQSAAWAALQPDQQEPVTALNDFAEWIDSFPGQKVAVASPALFDGMWIHQYCMMCGVQNPALGRWIDMRSYMMGAMGINHHETGASNMPRDWMSHHPHTHIADDDAIEQGETFCNMLKWRNRHELVEPKLGRAV